MHHIRSLPVTHPGLRGAAIAIGNFDGVHRGHQCVLAQARHMAAARGGRGGDARVTGAAQSGSSARWGGLTFEPHPRVFFTPDRPHFPLTPPDLKASIFQALGADLLITLPFDGGLAGLSADDFVAQVLVDGLGVSAVAVGHDFHYGRGRGGTPDHLRAAGARHGFAVEIVPGAGDGTAHYSSTRVREALGVGDLETARAILGYNWRVRGEVVSGAGRGHGLGFPTANVRLAPGQDLMHGIYAARVHTQGGAHEGAAYFGRRPTYDNGQAILETFLLDFDGSLYGQIIDVEFIAYLRPDASFESGEALARQMEIDVANAQDALRASPTSFAPDWPGAVADIAVTPGRADPV